MRGPLCANVILGFSQCRASFGESDSAVHKRVHAMLRHVPPAIVCVGETMAENEDGETKSIVRRQVWESLAGLAAGKAERLVIAHEPVWAIGTGRATRPDGANAVTDVIRTVLARMLNRGSAAIIRIQWGGGMTAANAAPFFAQSEGDRMLVGGASLGTSEFVQIVQAARA